MKIKLNKAQNKILERHLDLIGKKGMAGGAPTVANAAALLMTVIDEVNDDLAIGLGFMVDTSQAEKVENYFKELAYLCRR